MTSIDAYALHARVVPILVVCLPPMVLVGTSIITTSALGVSSGIVVTVFGAIASQLGRDRGRALQADLWARWGGSPTVVALRHRGTRPARRVVRAHECIKVVFGLDLPTAEEEAADPAEADERYDEAVERLIARTRDREKFSLLRTENQNYGQRRNLLGLRRIGATSAAATLVVTVGLYIATDGTADGQLRSYAPGGVVALGALWFWLRVVTDSWVKVPADAYASRLLEAAETLVTEQPLAQGR